LAPLTGFDPLPTRVLALKRIPLGCHTLDLSGNDSPLKSGVNVPANEKQ
jgi:hypothetical protein